MTNVLLSTESQGKYTYTRFAVKALLVFLSALTLSLPFFFRPASSLFYGFEAYSHLNHGTVSYILSLFSYTFNIDVFLVAKAFPFVLGVLSTILFLGVLKKLGFSFRTTVLATLILIFSPSFIFLFATLTDFAFVAFIMLLIFYFSLHDKYVLAFAFFYLVPFFGFLNLLLSSVMLLFYLMIVRKARMWFYVLPSFLLLLYSSKPLPSFGSFISDFGGVFGLGLFVILLSIPGILFLWKEKYTHIYLYLVIILLATFSFLNLRFLSYLNFILALLAALGFEFLFERRWRSKLIKHLTIIILVVGLFISGFSYMTSVINGLPNKDIVDGLYSLRDLPYGVVFSHESRAPWLDFSGKPFASNDALLYVRDIGNATGIINAGGIDYIWVDNDLKSRVWVEEDEGLLFLLKYSKSFKEVYSNSFVRIWEFEEVIE